ncbi:MAG TPA: M28 family peptidase [Saprospiraceae bacterium]|nr:M28 family peptidase [Saprospiraceae bacterium]
MKKQSFFYIQLLCFGLLLLMMLVAGCKRDHAQTDSFDSDTTSAPIPIPGFSRDTAYSFIERQLAFGVRNPGSPGIAACREWMVTKLEQYGATVIRQKFQAHIYNGKVFPSENIIGQFNPESKNRILLGAHYDTRFIADKDADPAKQKQPIAGADDGASGVAVLLEVARLLKENKINLGVDIVFFDAEDQGTSKSEDDPENISWCLGSQYWSKNPHRPGYKARFGILLDMVGAKNAFFNRENVQGLYPHAQEVHALYTKVWNLARAMGKGQYFHDRNIPGITDDHYWVNKIARITMIDIINKPPDHPEGFGAHWHTHQDDIGIIDKNTLASVGQVVTAVVYRTASGNF